MWTAVHTVCTLVHMTWFALVVAGVFEVAFAVSLERSEGLSRPAWTAGFLVAAAISLTLLSFAMKEIPVGTAYAVWTGIGAVGTATVGIIALGDPATAVRLTCIGLIVVAVLGLQLSASGAGA